MNNSTVTTLRLPSRFHNALYNTFWVEVALSEYAELEKSSKAKPMAVWLLLYTKKYNWPQFKNVDRKRM